MRIVDALVASAVTLGLGAGAAGCRTGAPRAGAPAVADTVRVDGSGGVLPLVSAVAREYESRFPARRVAFGAGLGSRERVQAVADGRIDIAMASHGLAIPEIRQRGMEVHEIAKAAIVFAVHAGVPVTALTQRQVCDIFSGAVGNWREAGGPDLAIAPRLRPDAEVDAEIVRAAIPCVHAGAAGAAVKLIERPEEMPAELARTPGAVGVTSVTFVEQSGGRIRAATYDGVSPSAANVASGAYPLVRPFYLVTKAPPPPAVARFLEFVRGAEGARVITANGAVPVR